MERSLSTVLLLAAAAMPASAQIGSVVRAQKINELVGGLVGPMPRIGYSLAALGDLNGDGVGDLATGLPTDNAGGHERGGVLVLFLAANGTVAGQQRINSLVGGFTATLPDEAYFGIALASPGDLDGDGLQELAVRSDRPRSVWILFLRPDGTVRTHREIPWSDPVYGGATVASDFQSFFERGLAAPGDLDGDGIGDLAVGAPLDDDGDADAGAIWILHLNADGTARAAKKISQTSGGLANVLEASSVFGHSLGAPGDVNGDGFVDLVAAEFGGGLRRWLLFLDGNQDVIGTATHPLTETLDRIGDLDGDGIDELVSEGFTVRFLAADGHLRKQLHVRPGVNGLPSGSSRNLGVYDFAALGDIDLDGTLELAAADLTDDQTGGAIWILSLARTAVQNGSGANPLAYTQAAEPVVGTTWQASVDCSGHAPGTAAIFGFDRPLSGVFVPAGELLFDPASRRLFQLFAPHAGGPVGFSAAIPPSLALVDLQIYSQAACDGAPGVALTNALYMLVGN